MINPVESHPNTSRVVGGSSASLAVVWLAGHFGLALSAEDGVILAGLAAGLWVFIGHDGLLGAWRRLMHGTAGKPTG